MSAKEYKKEIKLRTNTMLPQITGTDAVIEELRITVNIGKVLDPAKGTRFYLEVNVYVSGTKYTLTEVHEVSEVTAAGEITLGTVYVIGPVDQLHISYNAAISYIVN